MKKKLRLLLVADTYYPKVDGTLKFLEEFIKRAARDFDISLLVPNLGMTKKIKGVENIMWIKPSKRLAVSGYPNLAFLVDNIKKIKEAVQGADLVFVQGPALISYFTMYYSKKMGKRTVFYVHTISWELFAKFFPKILSFFFLSLIKSISLSFYNKCDLVIVPYQGLKEQLEEEGVETNIAVARLGVDINRFSPVKDNGVWKDKFKIGKDKFVVGYVGRISREKNTKVLLEAFKKLGNQDKLHLLMVGDGPKRIVRELEKLDNCTVTGFVNNVQDYLKAMDVFVMPSLTETTSLATLEAMSTGLPVIASRVGFIKNYIIRNHNGMFFPKESEMILAGKIDKLRKDIILREKLGSNARKTIAYSFSWERSINRIKRILQ